MSIRRPGAVHRTRCMASCLYMFKIFCTKNNLRQRKKKNIQDVKILMGYVTLLHAPYFMRHKCPLTVSAPRLDRDLWVDLGDYKKCFRQNSQQMVDVIKNSVWNHLWYLMCIVPSVREIWLLEVLLNNCKYLHQ